MEPPVGHVRVASPPRMESSSILIATGLSRTQTTWNSRMPLDQASILTSNVEAARKRRNRNTTFSFADQGVVPDCASPTSGAPPSAFSFAGPRSSSLSSRRSSSIYYKPPMDDDDAVSVTSPLSSKRSSRRVSILGHESATSRRFSLPGTPSSPAPSPITPLERRRTGTIKPLRLSEQFNLAAPSSYSAPKSSSRLRKLKAWIKRLFLLPALFFLFLTAFWKVKGKDLERDKALRKLTLAALSIPNSDDNPRAAVPPMPPLPFVHHPDNESIESADEPPPSPVALLHGLGIGTEDGGGPTFWVR
ncbi:hypothetical protein DL96DRAFT_1586177 [Flagelloscypha sp. PMI_526]|nr:hypothetical protein DL96DRAFT_1616232 [Flagelloscypha sp. PMI_526]KAH8830998.1 hypothetical protein DL96DRAFT_1586177 [Flagelloscypha sp. PMI_526]